MKFNKKAGLQMSINAIVMLVMAMLVLGLGVALIKNTFGSAEGKLISAIDAADMMPTPNSDKPLVFETTKLTIKPGKSETFAYGFYNADTTNTLTAASLKIGNCVGTGTTPENFNLIAASSDVGAGASVFFEGILEAKSAAGIDATVGTYICPVTFESASGSLTITVAS